MIGRGAYGFLTRACECIIPVDKVIPLLPDPVCEEWGAYRHGGEDQPIEVQYSREDDGYLLYAGNLRLREAMERGEQTIRAFVEADRGEVGPIVRRAGVLKKRDRHERGTGERSEFRFAAIVGTSRRGASCPRHGRA